MRTALLTAAGVTGITIMLAGCAAGGGSGADDEFAPQQTQEIMLEVRNQNFYDATLYAISQSERIRIGYVPGNSNETFTFRWTPIDLRIEVDLLSVGSFFTESMPVDRGDVLELVIEPDAHRKVRR